MFGRICIFGPLIVISSTFLDIQEDFYKFRQGIIDVSNYFTHLKVMWGELKNYRPMPTCLCQIPCSYGAIPYVP